MKRDIALNWRVLILTLMLAVAALSPVLVHAQQSPLGPIVPKGCNDPGGCQSVCDIAAVAQNVLNTGVYICVFLSAILFAWAGWKYLTAGGETGAHSEARRIFLNVLIGLLLILAGWLIVDALMKTLVGDSVGTYGPWNKIC